MRRAGPLMVKERLRVVIGDDNKSRNLVSVGRGRRSELKLQSKIQIFENISRGGLLTEDNAKCDPGQRASKGGWN